VHTLKYIFKGIFICIIKERCSNKAERTWTAQNGCHKTIIDTLCHSDWFHMVDTPVAKWASTSVSNGSGPSLRVRVRVGTKPEPDWRSGWSINLNCRFGHGSIDISLPVWIWAGSQPVVQWVHLKIHITCLLLLFDYSTQSKSIIWHPVITFCMFCILRDRQYFNSCFSFNDMYFWPGRRSIVQL